MQPSASLIFFWKLNSVASSIDRDPKVQSSPTSSKSYSSNVMGVPGQYTLLPTLAPSMRYTRDAPS